MKLRTKTGGRTKGTPNKITSQLRERIGSFLSENWSQIEEDFMELVPAQRIALFEKLLQYSLPRLAMSQEPEEAILKAKLEGLTDEDLTRLIETLKSSIDD
jgi:hypothetical protein